MKRPGPVLLLVGGLSTALAGCQYLPQSLKVSAPPAPRKDTAAPLPAPSVAAAAPVQLPASPVSLPVAPDRSRTAALEADNARLKNELATALRENAKLKKDLTDAMDDNALLKDLAAKKQR